MRFASVWLMSSLASSPWQLCCSQYHRAFTLYLATSTPMPVLKKRWRELKEALVKTRCQWWRHQNSEDTWSSLSGQHMVKVKMQYGWKQLKDRQTRRDKKEDPSLVWGIWVNPSYEEQEPLEREWWWAGKKNKGWTKCFEERINFVRKEDPQERTAYEGDEKQFHGE